MPVFVSVKFWEIVCPSTTLPKLNVVGETFSPACVPVPFNVIVAEAPALFATVMLPVAFPAAVGANFTASVAVAEGFNVNGAVTPLTLNPAPASVTPVICRAAFPVFVKVMFCEALLPTATLPKLKLFVLAVNCPTGAVVADPDNPIVSGEPAASLATVMLPVAFPVTLGANFTASVAFSDAFSVTGAVTPLTLNPLPAALILVIWTAAVPVFVTVTFCVALLPTDTLEKLKLVGLAVNCPSIAVVPVPDKPIVAVGVFGSLLVIAMLPVTAPAVVGAKLATTGTDWPALIVFGVAIPLIPNSAPFSVITETVKSAPPLLAITRFAVPFWPTVTLPKSTVLGLTEICG